MNESVRCVKIFVYLKYADGFEFVWKKNNDQKYRDHTCGEALDKMYGNSDKQNHKTSLNQTCANMCPILIKTQNMIKFLKVLK